MGYPLVNVEKTMERSTIFNGKTSTISMAMASIAFCMFTRPGSLKTCLQVQWIRTSNFPGFPALGIAPIDIYIYIYIAQGVFGDFSKGGKLLFFAHRIHVCYIWQHLPSIYPQC